MSQLIYQGEVRTELGAGEVRITDTAPDGDTPSVRRIAPDGSIRLEMGDRGQADDDLPTSIGSFFELSFEDTKDRAFQSLFGQVFDESRFEVELELPSGDVWHGYVKSTLQQRPLSRRTRPGQVSVTCYDRLAGLDEEDSAVNAFTFSIKTFLEITFTAANPDLDIVLYLDPSAKDVTGSTLAASDLVPYDDQASEYRPRSSDPSGLEGSTLRQQLDSLCGTFTAAAYQDLRLGAWAVIDLPSIGAPVEGLRYDGSSWSSFTLPEQTVTVPELVDEGNGRLEAMPSTKEVCSEVTRINVDPFLEQASNLGTANALYHWDHPNTDVLELGAFAFDDTAATIVDLDSSGQSISQSVTAEFLISDLNALSIKLLTETDETGKLDVETTITYGDGTTATATSTPSDRITRDYELVTWNEMRHYQSIDGSKERVTQIDITVTYTSDDAGGNIGGILAEFLIEDDVVQPDGSTVTKRRRVDRLCFQASGGEGRRSVDDDRGSALTELSNGRASPVEWSSDKYSGTYARLWLWRATQILALQPPGYEKLRGRILSELAPLGTRIQWTKPGDESSSTFVPLKGRTLHLASDEMSAGTQVKDVEIPSAVTDLL